jgi:hypothetical protein
METDSQQMDKMFTGVEKKSSRADQGLGDATFACPGCSFANQQSGRFNVHREKVGSSYWSPLPPHT